MTFEQAVKYVLESEGGYINHPSDPGGETNFGICKRDFPSEDIKNMTPERAAQIYKTKYWDTAKCELLPINIRYMHFDTAVNCGVKTAAKILQRACGVSDDGTIGAITLSATQFVSLQNYAGERLAYYDKIIKKNPLLDKFKKGWYNRVQHVLNKSK